MALVVGTPIDRVDGRAKVTGAAGYAADARPAGCANAVIVQSTIARGRIASIDTAEALRAPGVLAVLTHDNAPTLQPPKPGGGMPGEDRLPLSDGTIHYAGQHVAVVVADALEQAQYGASVVRVRYESELPVLAMADADATARSPAASLGKSLQPQRGNVDAALAAPGVIRIDARYTTPVETHNPMEPSVTVAEWRGDHLTVHDATQYVYGVRNVLADVFGLPRENVHVLCPFTGGAFGCKGSQWPHTMLAAMAARVTGRPVKLELTRAQMFTSVGHRPPYEQDMTLGATPDGRLVAIRHRTTQATSWTRDWVGAAGLSTSAILYASPNADVPQQVVRVNVATPTFMRAPAQTPGMFALESAMDELSYALGIDPVELRLRNYAETNPLNGTRWSSNHVRECCATGAERFGWRRRSARPGSMRNGQLLVGWGMATALYPAGRRAASARVQIFPDGRALVTVATHDLGTGAYTVFTQVAADALGLPVEQVTVELGDTDFPMAPGSGGSTTTATVADAIINAAGAARDQLVALAGSASASPLIGLRPDQLITRAGRVIATATPSRSMTYGEVVRHTGQPAVSAEGSAAPDPEQEKTLTFQSFGAHFCEVEIDPALPRVQVSRIVSVIDVGRVLNPKTGRSQILGGITMGIGMALMEQTVYDTRTGRPVTDNLADYPVPVNLDIRAIDQT